MKRHSILQTEPCRWCGESSGQGECSGPGFNPADRVSLNGPTLAAVKGLINEMFDALADGHINYANVARRNANELIAGLEIDLTNLAATHKI